MRFDAIRTPAVAPAGNRPYSPGVRLGDWIFLSGQVPIDADGNTVGAGEPAAQWRQCLVNIGDLLAAVGGSLADVHLMQIFVTDIRFYLDHGEIRREFFDEPYPAQTAVAVSSLANEDWVIEIQAWAYVAQR